MQATVLLIVAAQKKTAPAPFFGSDNQRRRIDIFYFAGKIEHLVFYFVHGHAGRMNITMSGVPNARFIVENVIAQASIAGATPTADQVLCPALLESGIRR